MFFCIWGLCTKFQVWPVNHTVQLQTTIHDKSKNHCKTSSINQSKYFLTWWAENYIAVLVLIIHNTHPSSSSKFRFGLLFNRSIFQLLVRKQVSFFLLAFIYCTFNTLMPNTVLFCKIISTPYISILAYMCIIIEFK